MKKHWLLYVLLLLSTSSVWAQTFDYGNNWYKADPNRTFIKLIVEEDGVYRVTAQQLQEAGFDLTGVNLQFLQLHYRGEEVPMYLSKSGGQLGYIEFFGRRNDGRLDSIMYRDAQTGRHQPDLQPNKNISLYSDESAYFLSWSNVVGKRYISFFNPAYGLYTPELYFSYEAKKEYHPDDPQTTYVKGGGGTYDPFYTLNCDYVVGEGYNGPLFAFGPGKSKVINISTPAAANFENRAVKVKTRVFGRSNSQHKLRVEMDGNSNQAVLDTTITANRIYIRTYFREHFAELDDITDLEFFALNPVQADNNNICWASITYDRLFDMDGGQQIRMKDWEKGIEAYLQFDNADGSDSVFVYNLNRPIRSKGSIIGGKAHVVVPGFQGKRDLFVVTDKGIKTPKIEKASFSKLYDPNNGAEYVIITNRLLQSSAEAYALYRDTATVTSLNGVRIVYTDEIYDEYGYGTITPWAIKRFCKDALDHWNIKPKYFLLWGKGNYLTRNGAETIVPTYGYPATDYEFISHYNQNSPEIKPEAAIGRINLFNNEDGLIYLEKVNEYEHSPWQEWMKKGIFLGGGGSSNEQSAISRSLGYYIDRFEAVPFGGETVYFQKTSSTTQDQSNSARYHEDISSGSSLIHFFGHSTDNIQDVTLKEPFEYRNEGRYPLMIAMGCFGGDFTPNRKSFGERWVTQKDKGSIGYIGGSSAGYLNPLTDYGKVFYDRFYQNLQGVPIGEALRQTMDVYTDSLFGIQYRNHGKQMNLQGDPAIILYHATLPDLEVNQTNVIFTPENFTAQDDSINVQVIVRNLAMAIDDSVRLTIQQRVPDGSLITHHSLRIPSPESRDTLSFTIYNNLGNEMTGQNAFIVFIDADEEIDEYSETNNRTNIDRIVPGNIPAILYPAEFAVVDENTIHLDASAFFITQEEKIGYIFEIDTSAYFDSPIRTTSDMVMGSSHYVRWDVPFTLMENQVYYWRVRLSDVSPSIWGNSSFKYIPQKTGWAQAKLPQFRKDVTVQVSPNELQKEWQFDQFGANYSFSTTRGGSFEYSLNGALQASLIAINNFFQDGIAFLEIDQFTLEPVYNFDRLYETYLRLAQTPHEIDKLKEGILSAKHGNYFVIGSTRNPHIPDWGDDIFEALELIGASQNLRLLGDGDAFLILGRKGYPNSAIEVLSPNVSTKYTIEQRLKAAYERGTVTSTKIGPAIDWQELYWDWESQDAIVQEFLTIKAYGEKSNGQDSLLLQTDQIQTVDLSTLNAGEYPYLRLEAELKDTVRRTAPQLKHWHVLFTPVPDAVVDPSTNFAFESDTVSEGQDVYIRMQARNITKIDMDSLLVKFSLIRSDRVQVGLDSMRLSPLLADQSLEFEYRFNTLDKGLDGNVSLVVEINPNFDQPEQHQFNNVYIQPFYVDVDKTNPLLDVTFDGKHIIDGDIISPRPEIVIQVNDENKYAALNDTSVFEIYWVKGSPNAGNPYRRVPVQGNIKVDWQPAELPENKALIYFYPGQEYPLEDGTYSLRVQGRDIKGNESGKNESYYEISFEVINQRTVTNVLNYPNPFSSATKFVYTLTGEEFPEVFQIHIYTISGKQIKVIDLLEMGEVKYGRNITDYAWDGTDDYGDLLANGVYLYRTVVKMPSGFTLREEGTGKYFNQGWGKMYIMR